VSGADAPSEGQRLYDGCSDLSDRINGLLHQIRPQALHGRRVLLAMQDAHAHLAAAEQLLAVARDARP
jgi:hypothetical protein